MCANSTGLSDLLVITNTYKMISTQLRNVLMLSISGSKMQTHACYQKELQIIASTRSNSQWNCANEFTVFIWDLPLPLTCHGHLTLLTVAIRQEGSLVYSIDALVNTPTLQHL